jgi:hypothetical protein
MLPGPCPSSSYGQQVTAKNDKKRAEEPVDDAVEITEEELKSPGPLLFEDSAEEEPGDSQ